MEGILVDREKAQFTLINFQIVKVWSNKQINLINNKITPLKSNWRSIENDTIIKNSLENNDDFILVNGVPYTAYNIVNEVKGELAKSIVKIMEDNEILSIYDLILEVEVDRVKKNIKTGEAEIVNPLEENQIYTNEDLIDYVLKSKNEVIIADVTSSNNVDEYVADRGGEIIEGFLNTLIKSAKDNEDKELIEAFQLLDGAWDVVDALNERVDKYIRSN